MAARWLAARRLPIGPLVAAALGLAVVASCVLPSYSVGDATSSGTGDTSASGSGGAGAGTPAGSTTASVGPGGSGIGGSGTGGELICGDDAHSRSVIAAGQTTPHGIALSASYVYWIGDVDNTVYYASRAKPHTPTALPVKGVCGLAAGTIKGTEQVVMRKTDGSISVATDPFGSVTPRIAAGGGPLDVDGACAISEDSNADFVYGFEIKNGVWSVMRYQLSKMSRTLVLAAQGVPVAIDATNNTYVGWVAALNGTGYFVAASKSGPPNPSTLPGAPPFPDLCAYGQTPKFAYIAPGASTIDTWPGGNLITNVVASRIACSEQHHVWIEPGEGCATLKSLDVPGDHPETIATNQARACSIALGGGEVFWTTCEPIGGVYRTALGN